MRPEKLQVVLDPHLFTCLGRPIAVHMKEESTIVSFKFPYNMCGKIDDLTR